MLLRMDDRRFQGVASLPPFVKSVCGPRGSTLTFLGNASVGALYRRMQNAALHTAGTTLRRLEIPEICMLPSVRDPLLPWLRKLVPDPYASAPLAPYTPTCWDIWNEGQSPAPQPPSPTVEQNVWDRLRLRTLSRATRKPR